MKLPSTIRFADIKIKESFHSLEKDEKELYKSINQALDKIEKNAFSGIQISKKLIPQEYKQKFGIENLWKYNLLNGWRLMYSITSDEIIVLSLILEWFDHKEYERKFKY